MTSSGCTPSKVAAPCWAPVRTLVSPSATLGALVRLFTTNAEAEPGTPIFTRKPMLRV